MHFKIKLFPILMVFFCFLSCKRASVSQTKDDVNTTTNVDAPTTPNIIFIIADDMGWDVFGKFPNTNGIKATTPTLDSLGATGIVFTNFWSYPECSPTRAAMLTGKYGFRTGVGAAASTLKSSETIIQKYIELKSPNVYSHAVIGKWHVSNNNQLAAPKDFGIEYYSVIMSGAVPDYYNWTENTNGVQQTINTYSTTHLVNESISWIEQQKTPFFLWLAFNAPHTPFHRPPLDLITNKTLSNNQSAINTNPLLYYIAAIEAMDKEISRLIAGLTPLQKENTVFVILGDNGTPSQVTQQPFSPSTAKSTLYQGGINTPLLVSGKNISRKNEVDNTLLQATDIFATLADIAEASSSDYQDSKSFKSLFTIPKPNYRNYGYSELFGSANGINDGYTLRNAYYKLIHRNNGTELFYKVSTDSFEQKNLLLGSLTIEEQESLTQLRAIKAGF